MKNYVVKQMEEMEEFLSRTNHLNIVLDNISKSTTTDKNDIYDMVYSKRKIENWLKLDIKNNDIKDDLNDILNRINTILSLLKSEDIEDILNRSVKNPSKLNKVKYDNANKFKDLKDSGNKKAILDTNGGLKQYLKLRLPRLITIGITLALMLLISSNILTDAVEAITPNNQEEAYTEEQSQSISEVIQEEELAPSNENMKETMIGIQSALSFMVRLFAIAIFLLNILGLSLDILYIFTNGQIGKPLDEHSKTMFSQEAIDATSSLKEIILDGDINNKDRLEVSRALLNNMIQYMNKVQGFVLNYEIPSINSDNTIKYAEDIMAELQEIKSRTQLEKGIHNIEAYVDAEIMYEYLESSIKNNKDWVLNVKKMHSLLEELE